jgi:hypothetical protein
MEDILNRHYPPPITHPENFYGFVGIAIAWQFAFLTIASDVQRFRPFMLPAILEKLSFGIATLLLYARHRVSLAVVGAGSIDLVLAIFFIAALLAIRTRVNRKERLKGQGTGLMAQAFKMRRVHRR